MTHILRIQCTLQQDVLGLTSVILMISPLLRHSFLLSSSTVFMFSIQTASTGPSNRYHFLSGVSLATPARMRVDRIPSVLGDEGGGIYKGEGLTSVKFIKIGVWERYHHQYQIQSTASPMATQRLDWNFKTITTATPLSPTCFLIQQTLLFHDQILKSRT